VLEVLDRLLPNLGGYAAWARGLFVVAILSVLVSVGVYAVYYNSATRALDASHITVAITPDVLTDEEAVNATEMKAAAAQGATEDPFTADLAYTERQKGDHKYFVPEQELLDAVRDGGDVDALSGLGPPVWSAAARPAVLDVKVTNSTDKTLLFSEAKLEVQRSVPDLRPLLIPMTPIDHVRQLLVINYGWGPARDVKLIARVASAGSDDARATRVAIGTVDRVGVADLSPAFASQGIDLAGLKPWEADAGDGFDQSGPDPRALRRAQRILAPLGLDPGVGEVALPVQGSLRYVGADRSSGKLRFHAKVPATQGIGFGDYAPPTARYKTVKLPARGTHYERIAPLSQRVKPGDTDRFEIPLSAAESSRHDLRVRLEYGSSEAVTSGPISVQLLVPRPPPDISQVPRSSH
jgi:hypothetical protein